MVRCEAHIEPLVNRSTGVWFAVLTKTFALQVITVGTLAGLCALGAGTHAGLACIMGGAAIASPNLMVGCGLMARSQLTGEVSAAALLGAEMGKLLLIGTAFYLSARGLGPKGAWLSYLGGALVALKAQWLALWFTRNS